MIKYALFFILATIISYILYMAFYLGAFKPVDISRQSHGPYITIYKDHMGPYHKIVPVIEEVETWAADHNINCDVTFGEYLDNPSEVEEARLRSRGGCVVNQLPTEIPPDFLTMNIPEKEYVTAIFKGSPGIGPLKVYPKVNDYLNENNLKVEGSVIELYEIHDRASKTSMTTTYLFGYKELKE